MSWLTDDADDQRVRLLEAQCKQKDALYATLQNEHDKTRKELHETTLSVKEANYKLSLEATRATENEKALVKRQEECKTFSSLRLNYESTIDALNSRIQAQEKAAKQLQKELNGQADNMCFSESKIASERDKLETRNRLLQSELDRTVRELQTALETNATRPKGQSTGQTPETGRVQTRIAELEAENAALRSRQSLSISTTPSGAAKTKNRRRSSSFGGNLADIATENQVNALRVRLDKANNDLTIASNQAMVLQKTHAREKQDLENKISDLEESLEEQRHLMDESSGPLRADLARLTTENDKMSNELADVQRQQTDAQIQCSTLLDLVRVKSEELVSARTEISRLEEVCENLNNEVRHLAKTSETANKEITSVEELVAQAHDELEMNSVALTQRDAEIKELKLMLDVSREAATLLTKEREHMLTDAVKLEEQAVEVGELQKLLVAEKQATVNAEQRCTVVEGELDAQTQQMATLELDFEHCKRALAESQAQLESLEAKLSETMAAFEAEKQTHEDLRTQLLALTEQSTSTASERDRLQGELDDALSSCAEAYARIEVLNSDLVEARRLANRDVFDIPEVQQIQFELSTARDEVAALQTALKEAETLENGLLNERVQAGESTAKLQVGVAELRHALEDAVESERCAQFALEVVKREHETALEDARLHQEELEDELEALEDAHSAVEKECADRGTAISTLKEEKSALAETVSELDEEIRTSRLEMFAKVAQYETTIAALQKQVESLELATTTANEALENVARESARLTMNVGTVEASVQTDDSPFVERESILKDKERAKLQQAGMLILRLREERDSLEARVAFLSAEQDIGASAEIVRRDQELSQVKSLLASKEASCNRTQTELSRMQESYQLLLSSSDSDQVKRLAAEVEQSRARVLRRAEQIAKLQSQVGQLEAQLAIAQDTAVEYERAQGEQIQLQAALDTANSQLLSAQEQLESIRASSSKLEEETAAALQTSEDALANKETDRQQAAAETSRLQELLLQLQNDLSSAKSHHATAETKLQASNAELSEELAQIKREAAEATSILQIMTEEKAQLQTDFDLLQKAEPSLSNEDLLNEIATLETAIDTLNTEKALLDNQLSLAHESLLQTRDERDAAQIYVEELKTKVHELASRLDDITSNREQDKQAAEDRLRSQDEFIRAKDQQIETFSKDIGRLQKEISTLRTLVSQKDESASKLEATLNMTRSEAETLVADFNLCSAELERRNAEDELREEEFALQERELEACLAERDELQKRLQTAQTSVEQAQVDIANLRKEKDALEGDNARISDLEEQLRIRADEVEETDERYLHSLKDIRRLQTTVERLQVRCETLQRTVRSLEAIRKSVSMLTAEGQSSHALPASMVVPTQNVASSVEGSSVSRKRAAPAEFDAAPSNTEPRAISIKPASETPQNSARKTTRTPPSSSQRQRALFKPAPVLKPVSANVNRRLSVLPDGPVKARSTADPNKLLADLQALRKGQ